MSKTDNPNVSLEISSYQLHQELLEIKERVGALEHVQSLSNADEILKHVRSEVEGREKRRRILQLCEEHKTRDQLRQECGFNNDQALDHHLKPLRDAGLIHVSTNESGKQVFVWSPLVKQISKGALKGALKKVIGQ